MQIKGLSINGDEIRAARERAGLTVNACASAAGISRKALVLVEGDQARPAREETLNRLAAVLDFDNPFDPVPDRTWWPSIAAHIRNARVACGMTQQELAIAVGLDTHKAVAHLENQRITGLRMTLVRRALGLDRDFYLRDAPAKSAARGFPKRTTEAGAEGHQDVVVSAPAARKARENLGMTRAELARRAGISYHTAEQIESTGTITESTAQRLRAVLPEVLTLTDPVPAADYWATIGKQVRQARNARLMTQDQLAYRTGMSRATVGKVERGQRCSADILTRMRHELDLPMDPTEDVDPEATRRRFRRPLSAPAYLLPDDSAKPLHNTWFDDAACNGAPVDLFGPVGVSEDLAVAWVRTSDAARNYCAGCPRLDECRQAAVDGLLEGVWGGALFRRYQDRANPSRIDHRMLAELIPLEPTPPPEPPSGPFERLCASCQDPFTVDPARRAWTKRRYCSSRCKADAKNALRRGRYRSESRAWHAGRSTAYGPDLTVRNGPAVPRTRPGNMSDFEAFKRSFRMPPLGGLG